MTLLYATYQVFFKKIQGLQHDKSQKMISQFIIVVNQAYKEITYSTLNYVWLSFIV